MSYSYDDAIADGWRPSAIRRRLRKMRAAPRRYKGRARAPARRVKRTLKRGYKTKRATFKSAAPRNARGIMSTDAAAYLKMLYTPSTAQPVRGPMCMTATAISSSRMRGSFASVATTPVNGSNGTLGASAPFNGWIRVMPALNFLETGINASQLVGSTNTGWNALDKVQYVTAWETSLIGTIESRTVKGEPDPLVTSARSFWQQYRPLACSIRIWNTSALDTRNGMTYFARTHLPHQLDLSSSSGTVLDSGSIYVTSGNNNPYVALNGNIVDLTDATGSQRTNQVALRINGDDITPVSATSDLSKIELSWRPMGPDDYDFTNVYSATRFQGNAAHEKLFQRTALDILVATNTAQTFEFEVTTVYEYVPNETANRIVSTEKGRVTQHEAAQAQEKVNDLAHGGQGAPETITSDQKEHAVLHALASAAGGIVNGVIRGAGAGAARRAETWASAWAGGSG